MVGELISYRQMVVRAKETLLIFYLWIADSADRRRLRRIIEIYGCTVSKNKRMTTYVPTGVTFKDLAGWISGEEINADPIRPGR